MVSQNFKTKKIFLRTLLHSREVRLKLPKEKAKGRIPVPLLLLALVSQQKSVALERCFGIQHPHQDA